MAMRSQSNKSNYVLLKKLSARGKLYRCLPIDSLERPLPLLDLDLAGLAAAQQLTRAGHTVAVYERAEKLAV